MNFEVGTSGGASAEDALRTLNTELVAGKGPDVLILDGMPLQSFIDKGVLAELSQVISADGLIPQVVDPMRTDGKLYAVPTRFTVPVLMGKPETLEGLDSLEALAAAGVDVDLCGHTHDGQMFPGNLTVRLFWENACGYLRVGSMHSIVTSGVGLFGPNMRVATRAEICPITIHFMN